MFMMIEIKRARLALIWSWNPAYEGNEWCVHFEWNSAEILPRIQNQVRLQYPVQILFLCREVSNDFINLSNYGPEKRCRTHEEEYAKHL